jgi:hypothetical protein
LALIGLVWTLLIGCGFSVSSAWAGYTVTLRQEGPNVVATGTGAIDLTGLSFDSRFSGLYASLIFASGADISTGAEAVAGAWTGSVSGPTRFGLGGFNEASSATGDIVGLYLISRVLVPRSYVNDTPLSDSATYDGATFSSLGVTPGTYEWSWGNGPDQNFTLIAVPEPRVGLLLGAGLVLLLGVRLRQLRFCSGAA